MRQKNFRRNILISPPPLIQTFSVPETNATVKYSPTEIFGTVRQKISTENLDAPPPLLQTFSVPEINATVKDSPTKIFGSVRQKIFDGKSCYSPLISIKFFATAKFSETQHRRVHLRIFSAL